MTFKKITIVLSILVLCGCSAGRDVRVFDANGVPVSDATLRVDYPSFNGPTFKANRDGVINYHKGHFDPVQVIIESPSMGSKLLMYPPPNTVILDGTRWQSQLKITDPDTQQGGQLDAASRRQLP